MNAVVEAAACINALPESQRVIWDGTAGLAGHALALSRAYPAARVLASDADAEMLALVRKNPAAAAIELRQGNFSTNPFADYAPFGFVLLDLGISSAHFDYFDRGFSFRFEQPLDMRMDTSRGRTAADLVNNLPEEDLAAIFFRYGEEKLSRRIARLICEQRRTKPFATTGEITDICTRVYPPKYHAKGHAQKHPSTRVFQALRIAVNGELDALEAALNQVPDSLCVGGRLAIITFHSLEDRMVKLAFRGRTQIAQTDPAARSNFLPGDFELIAPGGITPSEDEISENPRARSARLRILRRLR